MRSGERALLVALLLAVPSVPVARAQDRILPLAPPQLREVRPRGATRGAALTLTVQGSNLEGASAVLFDDPAIVGRIIEVKLKAGGMQEPALTSVAAGTPQQVRDATLTLEVTIGAAAAPGVRSFRVVTPRGSSNRGLLAVGLLPQSDEVEPNTAARAQQITLPTTIVGAIGQANDEDHFSFHARAGQTVVFRLMASPMGSALDAALTLADARGRVVAASEDHQGQVDPILVHRFARGGRHVLGVRDQLHGAGSGHAYRLDAGTPPLVPAPAAPGARLAELFARAGREREPNDRPAVAQALAIPGSVAGSLAPGDQDLFRFQARAGERLVLALHADRVGSPVDGELAIVDAAGAVLPRAVLRPVLQTAISLRNHGGARPGIRFESMTGFEPGDLVLIGQELMRIADRPEQPDMDVQMAAFRGRRRSLLGTTTQGHPLAAPIYKVEAHPPGSAPTSNGLPLATVFWKNDDAGPGRDPLLSFVAPADGSYLVRVRDTLGKGGAGHLYRLEARRPAPDFTLSLSPADPQVVRGGAVPVMVTATRVDDFEGAIQVQLADLPPGLWAQAGTIRAGEDTVSMLLAAAADAPRPPPVPLRVRGQAQVAGRETVREGAAEEAVGLVSLRDEAEVTVVSAEPSAIALPAGGRAILTVTIRRDGRHRTRVPLALLNLPAFVKVPDVGLNGILINEGEERREIPIVALPNAVPGKQVLLPVARLETRGRDLQFAGPVVRLEILPAATAAR